MDTRRGLVPVLYLSTSFPPTVPTFQLPTGNMTSFSLGICDSTKICVTFVGGSETLLSVHLPKHLSVFSTMHKRFVKLCSALAQKIHHLHVQLISHLCVLNISLPSENLQATALTATQSTGSLVTASDLSQKPMLFSERKNKQKSTTKTTTKTNLTQLCFRLQSSLSTVT